MTHPLRRLVAVLALVLLGVAPEPEPSRAYRFDVHATIVAAAASSAELKPRIGLEIHTPKAQSASETERQIDLARDLGFGFVRTDLFWARVETAKSAYDFSSFDPVVSRARADGLGILWTLAFGNTLYATPGYGNNAAGGYDPAAVRAAIPAFSRYAAAAAKHFAGASDIKFEIWNEPDRNAALDDASTYGDLFSTTLAAMRAADRDVSVSTGGVSNFESPLLSNIVDADTSKGATAIGVHPYRSHRIPETVASDVPALHASIEGAPTAGARIWDTEWGYSAYGDFPASLGDGHSDAARERQAAFDVRELLAIWRLGLPVAVLYELRDGGTNATNREDNFGLIDAAGSPKPAYRAIGTLSNVAEHRSYEGHFDGLPDGMHAMLLRGRGDADSTIVMWLDVPGTTRDVDLSGDEVTSALDMMGETIAIGTSGTVHLSADAGPLYLMVRKGTDRPVGPG